MFRPFLDCLLIKELSWERDVLSLLPSDAAALRHFYGDCLRFNPLRMPT